MSARACRRGRHVVAVFTLWLLAAACATTPGLQKADDSRAQGWRDQAARDYADALRREQLTPGERARARVAIRELTVELVDQDALRWVESEDPLAVAEPLARLRGRVDKLDEPQVSARYNARVSRYLERHRPTLEALRIQHRFVPAMALASALTTPLAADDPRQSLLRQVQDEGRDWHLAQAQVAQPYVVAVQFHLSMASRLGAELSPTQKAAVQAGEVAASFGWDLAGPAASCAADLQELVGRLGTGGAVRVRAEFRNVQCSASDKSYDRNEAYTYQVAYQVREARQVADGQEAYQETDTRPEPVCYSVWVSGTGQYARYQPRCTTEQRSYSVTKYRPRYRTVYELVTKYRDETGYRDVHYVEYFSALSADLAASAEGGVTAMRIDIRKEISDHSYTSPHGSKGLAEDHGPAKVRALVLAAAAEAVADKAVPPLARAAAAHNAALAQAATRPEQALHHWLLALHFEPSQVAARQWLDKNLGVRSDQVPAILAGTREVAAVQLAAKLGQSDLESTGSGYAPRDGFEFALERGYSSDRLRLGFEHERFGDVPFQPPRAALQFLLAAQHAVISRGVQDGFGPGIVDHAHWGLVIGGTTTPTYVYEHEQQKETLMGWGLDLGYALLVGVRTGYLGVFAGLDASYRYRHVGDVAGARASLLPRARLEWRANDRHPVIVNAWVGDLARTLGAGMGAEILLAVANAGGVVLGWDHESLDARMGGIYHSSVIDIGNRAANVLTVAYQFGF